MEIELNYLCKPQCRECKKDFSFYVNKDDYLSWKNGNFIQTAMPYLSAEEKELLISGTCESCFDEMFGEE